jgi:anti-sigma factor RsiW
VNDCGPVRSQFSSYLDGAVTGAEMQWIALHLEECSACAVEFDDWRNTQSMLGNLGPAKAPEDLALRLRIALSHQTLNTSKETFARWRIYWQNTLEPLVLQASAGLASTIVLLGTVALLVGMFATPEPLAARDEPLGAVSTPRFLYSALEPDQPIGDRNDPVVVEAFVNGAGQVYDYKIVSGANDACTRSQLEDTLLFSVFAPARAFGEPVRGVVLLSFSGVSVRG